MAIIHYKCNDCGNKITLAHTQKQVCILCGSTNLHYITPQEIAEEKMKAEKERFECELRRIDYEFKKLGEEMKREVENPGNLPFIHFGW